MRFPEFTDNWNQKALKDIISENLHPIEMPKTDYERLGLYCHAKGTFHEIVPIDKALNVDTMYVVPKDNLIVNITFAWEHAIAITTEKDAGKLVSHRFPTYCFNNGHVYKFYKYAILRDRFRYELGVASPGGAGRNRVLNKKAFLEIPMLVPSLPEQEKIAEFLSLVDERIEQQRQLVEALKRYKRGLFLRLYDDCDKKEYKISEIGKYCSTGALSKDDADDFGKYPCILYGELFTKYNEIIKQVGSRTNITPTYLSGNNEVLFPSSTTADALSLIFPSSLKIENIFLGGDLFVIKLYDKFDSDFISYLLNYVYKTQLARYTQGITIIHLHYTDIKDQMLDIPDINTQHKVAGIVNIIDMLIDKHTAILNAQIELKKGFLQQMFI